MTPVLLLALGLAVVEVGGYATGKWLTVSQVFKLLRERSPVAAYGTLAAVIAVLVVHLGFGVLN